MHRVTIEQTGAWFDRDEATKWDEDTLIDSKGNRISVATGTQWDHEALYRTRKGTYVLNRWRNGEADKEAYFKITKWDAVTWLIRNAEPLPSDLSDTVDEMEI